MCVWKESDSTEVHCVINVFINTSNRHLHVLTYKDLDINYHNAETSVLTSNAGNVYFKDKINLIKKNIIKKKTSYFRSDTCEKACKKSHH